MSQPNPFQVHGVNDNWLDVKYKREINALNKTLLEWQWEAFDGIRDAQFSLVSAFCGSGKSFLQVALAICEVIESGYLQKQLIVVPQQHISEGFRDHSIVSGDGQIYQWKVEDNFCESGSTDVINRLVLWLLEPASLVPDPLVITGVNAIASHQALVLAWNQMSPSERQVAVSNLTLRIDEAHHIKGVYDQDNDGFTDAEKLSLDQSATQLGVICQFVVSNGDPTSRICLTTATFYRGDQGLILSDMVKSKFSTYYLPWVRHWKTLGIESFDIQYQEYDSLPNLIQTVVQAIKDEPDERHLIVIPSTGQKWRRNGPEYLALIAELKKFIPEDQILDLVNPVTQDQNKERLLREPKQFSPGNPPKFRVTLTCMLGREGSDWCPCSRIHNLAPESSITLAVQTLGRVFRRFEGKQKVKVNYYVQRFAAPKPGMTRREILSDRTNALLVCVQMDDMAHPIMVPVIEAPTTTPTTPGTPTTPPRVGISGLLGSDYPNIVRDVITEVGLIPSCTRENIQAAIDSVLAIYTLPTTVSVDAIRDALLMMVVRRFTPQEIAIPLDVEFVRERGFDKIFQDHINGKTLFFGNISTADWEIIRQICISSAAINKAKLLEMARNGEPRPKQDTQLGRALCAYIAKSHGSYDPDFDCEIRRFAPHWWEDTVAANKARLLEMARNGEPRPSSKVTSLGKALVGYTSKSNDCYDPDFDKEVREFAPHWWEDTTAVKKAALLEMVRNGEPRPKCDTQLGRVLNAYIAKSHGSYDPVFDREIRLLAPHWWEDTVAIKKARLLEMARNGEPRPNQKISLGMALSNYTRKGSGSYDPEFTDGIKLLAPHWWEDTVAANKAKLLEMARNGEPRPNRETSLGGALSNYIAKGRRNYDSDFDREIRALAPQWWEDTAAANKVALLEMARNGESKPKRGTLLGGALLSYTYKSSGCYNPDFDKEIREVAPQWFEDTIAANKAKLLEMARNGKSKPSRKAPLGKVLNHYTWSGDRCYDPVFDEEIRRLAPHWFKRAAA